MITIASNDVAHDLLLGRPAEDLIIPNYASSLILKKLDFSFQSSTKVDEKKKDPHNPDENAANGLAGEIIKSEKSYLDALRMYQTVFSAIPNAHDFSIFI